MKLLKVKWVFNKPKKKKILIYDKMSEENGFAEIFFQKKDYEILYRRYEKINLYVFFLCLLRDGFKELKDNYRKTFLTLVSPKIVYTSIDNDPTFFKLKHLYNKSIYISDQNGMSKVTYAYWPNKFYRECVKYKKEAKRKPEADHIFLFGKNEKERISPIINGKIHILGNTKNNNFPIKLKKNIKKIKSIMFISSGLFKEAIEHEKLIFSNINKYCLKKNIRLSFCGRLGPSGENFHREHFAKGNWIYLPSINPHKNYFRLNKQQMVVFAHSTLGYEALAKGIKCAVFSSHFPEKNSHKKYPKKGPFWTNSLNYYDFEKVLNRVIAYSNKDWKKIAAKYSSDIIAYDPANTKKKKIIKMALKNFDKVYSIKYMAS